jgi:hypothetical protein
MRLIRFVLLLLGAAAFLIAAAGLAAEAWSLATSGTLFAKPLGKLWFDAHKDSLLLLQPAVERYLFPGLWSAIQWVLERPAWLVPAVAGAVVALFKIVRRR